MRSTDPRESRKGFEHLSEKIPAVEALAAKVETASHDHEVANDFVEWFSRLAPYQ
jgi:hypothetical protein